MRSKRWKLAGLSVVVTLAAVLLFLNLSSAEKQIQRPIERLYSLESPQFKRSLNLLLGPPLTDGNAVQVLLNGDQIFPAMLDAIRSAKHSITFETFIYWDGNIGQQFANALLDRAKNGVSIHIILDWLGSAKIDQESLARMRLAGIQVERFHKPSWWTLDDLNNRTHRKLLVIDGQIGFTGGVGIADQWLGSAQDPAHWRDTHFRIEGPVVAQLQIAFVDNWIKSTGTVLHGEKYFPPLSPAGSLSAQMFVSSPSGGSESMQLMYLTALTSASKSILLSAAYFVPDELTRKALIDAAERGVQITIIVPGEHIDTDVVRWASRESWGELLKAGITIAEYVPTMYHCKVLIVDDFLVSVGSTNFDSRSFKLNDEANLNVLDHGFAVAQRAIFEQDLADAQVVSLEQWANRPWREKLFEKLSAAMADQL